MTEEQQEIEQGSEETPTVSAGLTRLFDVIWSKIRERGEAVRWFEQWVPLLDQLQSFGMTLASVMMGIKARAESRETPYLDDEELEQLRLQITEIFEASPDAAELIFGLDNVDDAIGDIFADEQSRAAVGDIVGGLERRMDGVIQRLIDWGLGREEPQMTPEQLQAVLEQVERVLQEAIDRWVLPRLMDKPGDS